MKRLLPLALVVSGCVHMSHSVLVDRSDRPVPEEDVQVFFEADEMPATCQHIADLHAEASEDFASEAKVVGKFRKEAGKLGANAVRVREAYGSSGPTSSLFDSRSDKEFDGEAFWCPEDDRERRSAGR